MKREKGKGNNVKQLFSKSSCTLTHTGRLEKVIEVFKTRERLMKALLYTRKKQKRKGHLINFRERSSLSWWLMETSCLLLAYYRSLKESSQVSWKIHCWYYLFVDVPNLIKMLNFYILSFNTDFKLKSRALSYLFLKLIHQPRKEQCVVGIICVNSK